MSFQLDAFLSPAVLNLSIGAFVINLSLGLFVLFKDFHKPTNRLFFFFSLSQAIWWLDLSGLSYLPKAAAVSWNNILQAGLFFIAPTAFHFFVEFLQNREGEYKRLVWFFYSFALCAICVTWIPGFETKLMRYSFGYYPVIANPVDLLYLFNLLLCLIYASIASFKKYKATISRLEKRQLQYLLLGIVISILSGYVVLLGNFNERVYPGALIGQIVYICLVFYAILEHRLWNLDVVINKIFFSLFLVWFTSCSAYSVCKSFCSSIRLSFSYRHLFSVGHIRIGGYSLSQIYA